VGLHGARVIRYGLVRSKSMYRQVTLVIGLTLSGCAAETVDASSTSTGITTVNPMTSGGASVSTSSGPASESGGSGGESTGATTSGASQTTLDPFTSGGVPDFATTGEELPVGCGGKIDFLFIISRDSTMADQIAPLTSSLPGFVATMQSAFENFDVHIMTVKADGSYWGMEDCEDQCEANNWATCAPIGPVDYPCGAYVQSALTKCDDTRGAGVTFPAAWGASNKRCQLAGGNRYIIDSEPDLLGAFECIATMGLANKYGGMSSYSMRKAISEELLEPGGCNEGFLRDDALLVLTFITDLSDSLSPNEPEDWALDLRAAKGFDDDAIVILGLIPDGLEENNVCDGPGPGDYLPPLNTFLTLFPHTVLGSCCATDYVPFFEEAADMVLDVCEQYLPQ
jgi:hypothetical protein